MAYGDFKDLFRRRASDKILRDEAFNIAKYLKFDRYQRGLVSMVYELFDKKTSDGAFENENMLNEELAEKLHRPIIKNIRKEKYTHLLQTIFGE